MLLVLENSNKKNPTIDEIINSISQLDGIDTTFMILEMDYGSYIQIGGGPEEFTVEVRSYFADGDFRHCKAETYNPINTETTEIYIGGVYVKVHNRKILSKAMVAELVHYFLNGNSFQEKYDWDDITNWFN